MLLRQSLEEKNKSPALGKRQGVSSSDPGKSEGLPTLLGRKGPDNKTFLVVKQN